MRKVKILRSNLNHLIIITVVLVVFIGGMSCSGTSEILKLANTAQAAEEVGIENPTVEANNQFGLQLFQRLYQTNKNLFISPLSISIALTMTLNGATGDTQQEMKKALALSDLDLETINSDFGNLQKSLQLNSSRIKLQIANSLWGREDLVFDSDFLQTNRDYFNATLQSVNFKNQQSIIDINQWVKDRTSGKIDRVISQVEPETILFLINAVYFKGNWTKAFNPKKTTKRKFFLIDGSQRTVDMMSQSGRYLTYKNSDFQAIRLPYGNGRLGMYVLLPDSKHSLTDWVTELTITNWKIWQPQFVEREGDVVLPKFKVEYEKDLNSYLSALGMKLAFVPNQADFSNICKNPSDLYIGGVKHKSYIEVAEEGTEAAGVTSVQVRTTTSQPNRLYFVANRPFAFIIEDQWTGSILFLGIMANP